MACPNCLDCNNPCNECQENTPATPQPYTPVLPPCNTGCEFEVFTDCVLLSDDMTLCNVEYPKNSPLTQLLIDLVNSNCCNCTSCDNVTKTMEYSLNTITKSNTDYDVLNSLYFTKNSLITQFLLEDNSSSSDVVTYLKYNLPSLSTMNILTNNDLGGMFSLNTHIIGKRFLNNSFSFFSEMMTSRNCYEFLNKDLISDRVLYSERIAEPYRFNAQINDVPLMRDYNYSEEQDKGILYFADTATSSTYLNGNKGSTIRKVNLNTKEIETISGTSSLTGKFDTINGLDGTKVIYGRASSLILDREEMYNDEPVIYFCTYGTADNSANNISERGGVVCRLVKEANNINDDERTNWTTHVIANINNTYGTNIDPASPISGSEVTFKHLYGLKRWFNINGAPSFYLYDAAQAYLYFMYHTGDGSMNSASNWLIKQVNLPSIISYYNAETGRTETYPLNLGGVSSNINVDVHDTYSKKLIITNDNGIYHFDWNGSLTPSTSECTDLTGVDWTPNVITYNSSTCLNTLEVNGLFDPSLNTNTVTVYNPNYVYRPVGQAAYLYGTGRFGSSLKTAVRSYELVSGSVYSHFTMIMELNPTGITSATTIRQSIGNSTSSTTTLNGLSEGFFNDLKGNLYDITYGGIRLWSDDLLNCDVYIGQESGTATELKQSLYLSPSYTYRMDTQYQFNIV